MRRWGGTSMVARAIATGSDTGDVPRATSPDLAYPMTLLSTSGSGPNPSGANAQGAGASWSSYSAQASMMSTVLASVCLISAVRWLMQSASVSPHDGLTPMIG